MPTKSTVPESTAAPERAAPAPAPQTRDDPVLRATYDSVMEVGVRRTTLADVARRAGVSRMTVYRKYDDLSRLLAALLSVELAAILASAKEHTMDSRDTRTMLARTVTRATVDLATHPVLARVLAVDPEAMLPLIVDRFGSTQLVALAQVADMIRAGQSPDGDGSIRAGDPEMLALTILAYTQSFVFSARAISTVDPLGKSYAELETLTLRYLAVESGDDCDDLRTSQSTRVTKRPTTEPTNEE
ncbi:MAG: TetR/AcrR family transcriptional regulator [Actinomycetes bacterium]